APLALCYFQELTYEDAAGRTGISVGALRGRLERGKELLRKRLVRYGLPLVAPVLVLDRPPSVHAALTAATVRTARAGLTGAPVAAGRRPARRLVAAWQGRPAGAGRRGGGPGGPALGRHGRPARRLAAPRRDPARRVGRSGA